MEGESFAKLTRLKKIFGQMSISDKVAFVAQIKSRLANYANFFRWDNEGHSIATTDSAPEAVAQKPVTKAFRLRIEQTRYYYISVEAESAEQAEAGWEVNNYEYSANNQPEYKWDDEETLTDAIETGQNPETTEVDYETVCHALELPFSEKWER